MPEGDDDRQKPCKPTLRRDPEVLRPPAGFALKPTVFVPLQLGFVDFFIEFTFHLQKRMKGCFSKERERKTNDTHFNLAIYDPRMHRIERPADCPLVPRSKVRYHASKERLQTLDPD